MVDDADEDDEGDEGDAEFGLALPGLVEAVSKSSFIEDIILLVLVFFLRLIRFLARASMLVEAFDDLTRCIFFFFFSLLLL